MDIQIKLEEKEADAVLSLMMMRDRRYFVNKDSKLYKNKTKKQVRFLMAVFVRTRYPSSNTRSNMSILLGISPRKIQIWFQNRRQAEKDEVFTMQKSGESSITGGDDESSKSRSRNIKSSDILQIYIDC